MMLKVNQQQKYLVVAICPVLCLLCHYCAIALVISKTAINRSFNINHNTNLHKLYVSSLQLQEHASRKSCKHDNNCDGDDCKHTLAQSSSWNHNSDNTSNSEQGTRDMEAEKQQPVNFSRRRNFSNYSSSSNNKSYYPYALEHYEINYEEEENKLKTQHYARNDINNENIIASNFSEELPTSSSYHSNRAASYNNNSNNDNCNTAVKQKMEDDTSYILYKVPLGQLTPSNMVTIQYLMYGWASVAAAANAAKDNEDVSSETSAASAAAVHAATIIELLLKRVLDDYHAGNKHTSTVTTKMYSVLVRAWSACCDDHNHHQTSFAQRRCRQIIDNLQSLYETTGDPTIQPDVQIYNYFLNIMAITGGSNSTAAAAAVKDTEDIVEHMQQLYDTGVNTLVHPDAVSYTALINLYAKSIEPFDPSLMVDAGVDDANIDSFSATSTTVDRNSSRRQQQYEVATRKEKVVNRVLDIFNNLKTKYKSTGDIRFRPNKFTYSAAINCLAKSGLKKAAKMADELLMEMSNLTKEAAENIHSINIKYDIAPNVFVYNTVLYAYSHVGNAESAQRAEDILMEMEQQQQVVADDDVELNNRPNILSYNHVIYAWANCCYSESDQRRYIPRAETILQRLLDRNSMNLHQKQHVVKPDKRSYTIVLFAWTKRSYLVRESVEKAESFLLRMLDYHEQQQQKQEEEEHEESATGSITTTRVAATPSHPLDTVCYSLVMHAWGRTRLRGAAQSAELLLLDMQRRYEGGNLQLKPTTRTFTALLDAWSKSPEPIAAQRAEDILRQMHFLSESKGMDLNPDVFCYTIVISCWAKSSLGKVAAERAEQILNYMERQYLADNQKPRPNVRTYNAVIDAWSRARSDEAPARCDQLLCRMIQLYEDGDPSVVPETFTFNAVMNVWANRGVGDVSTRVREIFNQMLTFYESGIASCAPDERSYTVLLKANSISPDGGEKSIELLSEMITWFKSGKVPVAPTFACFKIAIEFLTRSQRAGSACRAGAILQLMIQLSEEGWIDIYPSPFCFRLVIASFAYDSVNPESAVNATMVLRQMHQAIQAGLTIDSKPTAHDFIIVLNAWAKSKLPQKAVYSEQVLRDLLKECRPGNEYSRALVSAYTIVLNSCAFASGDSAEQKEAFAIAKTCLWETCHSIHGKPNFVTFGTFLKACGRLDIDAADRNANIRAAFEMACERNEANEFVIAQLRYAAPNNLYTELVKVAEKIRRERKLLS